MVLLNWRILTTTSLNENIHTSIQLHYLGLTFNACNPRSTIDSFGIEQKLRRSIHDWDVTMTTDAETTTNTNTNMTSDADTTTLYHQFDDFDDVGNGTTIHHEPHDDEAYYEQDNVPLAGSDNFSTKMILEVDAYYEEGGSDANCLLGSLQSYFGVLGSHVVSGFLTTFSLGKDSGDLGDCLFKDLDLSNLLAYFGNEMDLLVIATMLASW